MSKITFSDRLRYHFDNLMARGTGSLIIGLGILSLIAVAVGGLFLSITGIAPEGEQAMGFMEGLWQGLMRTLDAGTMGGDTGWSFRMVMFIMTICGIFFISALIGILTSGMEQRLEELRKGRSTVLTNDHTIILGWSPHIFSIISELSIANESKPGSSIVIMADKDKVEMEDEIRDKIPDLRKTRVICRSGSPMDIHNLKIVSPDTSRSILLLANETSNSDADMIKTILAIINSPGRRPEPYHIVAEIHDFKNLEVAKMVGKDEVELLLVGDIISRLIAQTCRQSGLSIVYTELLDFGGDEMYFKEEPSLTGKTYRDSLFAFETSTIVGIFTHDKRVLINPEMNTKMEKGDRLIFIAEDDSAIQVSNLNNFNITEPAIQGKQEIASAPEYTLFLGWNRKAPTIIIEMDNYSVPGSQLTLVADYEWTEEEKDYLKNNLKNNKIEFRVGDTTDRRILDSLNVPKYSHVILLCYSEKLDEQTADAQTLITLLHLRDIAEQCGHNISIVSEMLDIRNRELAQVTKADDFIVSDKLISLMISQVSENKYLNDVFKVLFTSEGSEIYLKPAVDYITPGHTVNFYTVLESAARQNETAIGYRIKAHANDEEKAYGVVINPPKSNTFTLNKEDKVIVLAES